MDNRKLEIARKLAIKEFAVSREDDVSLDDLSIDSAAVVPSHRASDIICDPRNTSLYSHHIERSYVTQLNLNAISAELEKAMRHSSITLLTLVKTMRRMLKVQFHYHRIDPRPFHLMIHHTCYRRHCSAVRLTSA